MYLFMEYESYRFSSMKDTLFCSALDGLIFPEYVNHMLPECNQKRYSVYSSHFSATPGLVEDQFFDFLPSLNLFSFPDHWGFQVLFRMSKICSLNGTARSNVGQRGPSHIALDRSFLQPLPSGLWESQGLGKINSSALFPCWKWSSPISGGNCLILTYFERW